MRIVAVHGVGNPAIGSIVSLLASRVKNGRYTTYNRKILTLAGKDYAVADSQDEQSTILEVNWADLRKPLRNPIDILKHLLLLMSAMLTIPATLCEEGTLARRLLLSYRVAFEAFIFWVLFFPVLTMLIITSSTNAVALTIGFCGAILLSVIALTFGSFSSWYRAGYFWALAIVTVAGIATSRQDAVNVLITLSSRLYLSAQLGLAVLLFLCLFALVQRKKLLWEQRFAHFALLYLPFALLSGLGAVLWSATLFPSKAVGQLFSSKKFELWGETFLKALHYDLRPVEWVFTIAIASIGGMALGVVGLYFARAIAEEKNKKPETVAKRDPRDPGIVAQQGVKFLLYAMPFVLAGAGAFFLADLIAYGKHAAEILADYAGTETSKTMSGTEVLTVYRTSALRLIPFLGFMVGPLTIVVDVIGDVVFFLAADKFSIQEEAVARVSNGLLASRSDGTTTILCHSQGSILVRQALVSFPKSSFNLLTVGSPFSSIYSRFLGWSPEGGLPPGCKWVNAFRTGDYIGGYIGAASRNIALGNGGHTDYWSDDRVWSLLDEMEVAAAATTSEH